MKNISFVILFLITCNTLFAEEDWRNKYNDLLGKTTVELRLLKNEIYARHGKIFKEPDLKKYFSKQSWYKPNKKYNDTLLSEKESILIGDVWSRERMLNELINPEFYGNSEYIQKMDINGDGKEEIIDVRQRGNCGGTEALFINGTYIMTDSQIYLYSFNLFYPFYSISDIDIKDNFKEILVPLVLFLPNNEKYLTKFYYYDGNNVIDMGTIEGYYGSDIKIDGLGFIKTSVIGNILKGDLYQVLYMLDKNHRLTKISSKEIF